MTPQKDYVSNLYHADSDDIASLAVYISESKCSLAVCNETALLLLLKSYQKPDHKFAHQFIRSVFAEHQSLFAKDYRKISIGIQTSNFTIIPNEFQKDHKELMNFLSGSPTRITLEQNIDSLKSKLLYSIPINLKEVLEQTFQNYELYHCSCFGMSIADNKQFDGILVVDDHDFDCFFYKDQELIFANRYHWESEDDILYYCLLGLEECGVEPKEAHVLLSGNIMKYSSEYEKLLEYIKFVEVAHLRHSIKTRPDFDEAPHKYQYLFNLLDAHN